MEIRHHDFRSTSMNTKRDCPSYWSVYRRARKRTACDFAELHNADVQQAVSNVEEFELDQGSRERSCDEAADRFSDCTDSCDAYENVSCHIPELSELCSSSVGEDDSDTNSDSSNSVSLSEQLAQWYLDCGVSHTAVNKLLAILKPHFPSLPLDVRTLVQTPRHVEVKPFDTGEYVHLGLESGILKSLQNHDVTDNGDIRIQINVDGLPLFKSSNVQFWPILCLVKQPCLTDPFVVGLFSGNTKPPVWFLNDFIHELQQLMKCGMIINGNHVQVKVHSFVCDAPARAFIKCTKLHSGYSSCDRCDQHGEWCGKVVFASAEGTRRTNESFRNQTDDGHHLQNIVSPLTSLDIDMISHFPLDPMHLLHLGVMRRLLLAWLRGPLTVRWPARVVSDLSAYFLSLRKHIPSEFCRRPRSLAEIDRWKATEFRMFLLYCGPVALKGYLPDSLFKHFLLLFVASTILSDKKLSCQFQEYASGLLSSFVLGVAELYGRGEVVYNVHCLLHVVDDVARYGCLDSYSAYPFENKLKDIKRLVRKPGLPLQQVARRLVEQSRQPREYTHARGKPDAYNCYSEHTEGPVPDGVAFTKQFRKLSMKEFIISVNQQDACVQLKDMSIAVVRNILIQDSDKVVLVHNKFRCVRNFFDYPLPSSSVGISEVSSLAESYNYCDVDQVHRKCMLLPVAGSDKSVYVVLPLM